MRVVSGSQAWLLRVLRAFVFLIPLALRAEGAERPPNFVVFFVDNLGNGDVGCFGSKLHRTPHIDRLAAEGTKFTSFYVASGVCTPSRAALLTGCYPRRVNMHVSGSGGAVLRPLDTKGLHPDELTIAEVLKAAGYVSGIFGKWHLGDQPPFLPARQGFEVFFGIPYSDDMTKDKQPQIWPELPLMRGEAVIEAPADRNTLVKRCTEEAIAFIEQNRDRPFFCYIPHTMPGSTPTPFSSPAFRGKSKNGDYGDAVEELDWSTGQIVAALQRLGLTEQTLVIWTSDNGAVARNPPQGSGAPYKGVAYDTSEAAMRMPCVMKWPGHVPAGRVCDEIITTMDLLPTFAYLAGAKLPAVPIDGHDVRPLLFGEADANSPWDEKGLMYYRLEQLQAVRAGPWKLYLPLEAKVINNQGKTAPAKVALFNVRDDVSEASEVSTRHPEVVQRLMGLADAARVELGDVGRSGRGQRPAGFVSEPKALR
jgi:arylsulfatase A-like enzyme